MYIVGEIAEAMRIKKEVSNLLIAVLVMGLLVGCSDSSIIGTYENTSTAYDQIGRNQLTSRSVTTKLIVIDDSNFVILSKNKTCEGTYQKGEDGKLKFISTAPKYGFQSGAYFMATIDGKKLCLNGDI